MLFLINKKLLSLDNWYKNLLNWCRFCIKQGTYLFSGKNTREVFMKNKKQFSQNWQLGNSVFSRSSINFWRGLEEPRSYKIYSSGNRGVKKVPGPRGSRDEEFLVPSLSPLHQISKFNNLFSF